MTFSSIDPSSSIAGARNDKVGTQDVAASGQLLQFFRVGSSTWPLPAYISAGGKKESWDWHDTSETASAANSGRAPQNDT